MSDREQIGFRFPSGTRQRLAAQRLERESLMGVLLRGLDLLEQQDQSDHHQGVDVVELARRVEAIELKLGGGHIDTAPTPAPTPAPAPADQPKGTAYRYPEAARRKAVEMSRAGYEHPEINAMLAQMCGRVPSNITLSLQSWSAGFPVDDDGSAV